jgi:hypothetical protein
MALPYCSADGKNWASTVTSGLRFMKLSICWRWKVASSGPSGIVQKRTVPLPLPAPPPVGGASPAEQAAIRPGKPTAPASNPPARRNSRLLGPFVNGLVTDAPPCADTSPMDPPAWPGIRLFTLAKWYPHIR